MKKLITLALALIMAMTMTVAASAAFVSSPSASDGPVIEDIVNEDGEEVSNVVLTPYKDREDLDAEAKKDMEEAYDDIKGTEDLTDKVEGLEEAAKDAKADKEDLAVKDLFNLGTDDGKELDGKVTITLKPEELKNFVALIVKNGDEWAVVEDVEFDKKNGTITFDVEELGTYAIVVNTSEKDSPATSDAFDFSILFMVGTVLFGAAAAFCFAKSRVNG